MKYNPLDTPSCTVWNHQILACSPEKPGNPKVHYLKQFTSSVQVLFTCMTEYIQAETCHEDSPSKSIITTKVCLTGILVHIHSLTVLKSYEKNVKNKKREKSKQVN